MGAMPSLDLVGERKNENFDMKKSHTDKTYKWRTENYYFLSSWLMKLRFVTSSLGLMGQAHCTTRDNATRFF